MFSLTFLGHQGWACRTDKASVLIDPLLCEDFGQAHALGYRVFPPRRWKESEVPPLDAVFLTHEHDDHFDIPSLAKLARSTPLYLSARSSDAARQVLRTMGFDVRPLVPGAPVLVEDLELTPFCGDHLTTNCGDEWDTLPFLVRDRAGSGSFFSLVDITITEGHVAWAKSRQSRPGLVSWTNNALDWSHMTDYLPVRTDATQECFMRMGMGHKLIETKWGNPAGMIMCAGGFAFEGDRAWMNQRVFCVDNDAVCQTMGKLYPQERFVPARPGQTFHMRGGRLQRVDDVSPFLETGPKESWPSRAKTGEGAAPDYEPATGKRTMSDADWSALDAALAELAGAMVGGVVFRNLCSLLESEAGGRALTFALVARDGDGRRVFAYAPTACAFVPAKEYAEAAYVAGMECWGSDLLAVLRGELGPIALTFGRARLWNALPKRLGFNLFEELYRVSHPLRRPAQTLAIYERAWDRVRDTAPIFTSR